MRTVLLRLGLLLLGLGSLSIAVWGLASPLSFFRDYPGVFGLRWVAPLPEYSEHLVNEIAVLRLALAALALWAVVRMDHALVRPLLVAWSLQAVPHLVHHVQHIDAYMALGPGDGFVRLDTASAVTLLAYLTLEAVLPILLLILTRRRGAREYRVR